MRILTCRSVQDCCEACLSMQGLSYLMLSVRGCRLA